MPKEPIRHHYIPQFILRNFACDTDRKVACYYDKESQSVSEREIREVFMERNFYRDEINCKDKPVQIEYDLSVYEREVSELIKAKFLDKRKIELTKEEDSMLKLFFAIMSFRNINAKEQFSDKARWISCIRSSSSVRPRQRMANELSTCPIVCGGYLLNGKRNLSANGYSRIYSSRSYRWIRAKPIASSKQYSKRVICPTFACTTYVIRLLPMPRIRESLLRPCPRSSGTARRASRWTTTRT